MRPAAPASRPAHPNRANHTPRAIPKKGEQKDSIMSVMDFAQTRSKKDADLLWEAK